jgi:hypothetical protein
MHDSGDMYRVFDFLYIFVAICIDRDQNTAANSTAPAPEGITLRNNPAHARRIDRAESSPWVHRMGFAFGDAGRLLVAKGGKECCRETVSGAAIAGIKAGGSYFQNGNK